MLTIWFMFDNHTFERINETDRDGIFKHAFRLFGEDSCGSLFVRDKSETSLNNLTLHSHQLRPGKYGVLLDELEKWADEVMVERSFRTIMA